MNWNNVQLISRREIIDQLRDRRTLFTILVLPLILYPLLGMSLLQTAQFMHKSPARVWIVGHEFAPSTVGLVDGSGFANGLAAPEQLEMLQVVCDSKPDLAQDSLLNLAEQHSTDAIASTSDLDPEIREWLQQQLKRRKVDVLVVFPRNFSEEESDQDTNDLANAPALQLFIDSSKSKSALAAADVNKILSTWRAKMIESNFVQRKIPFRLAFPFSIQPTDIVDEKTQRAVAWAKVLPFVVILWALTGAFYPAIDLCAGEKERGTLETLLSSPAARAEIVIGKMLTVMIFSLSNALLNLLSMLLTGVLVMSQIGASLPMSTNEIGLPPFDAIPWIVVGLIPVSAMFSALALALASFARSSKEGQYYLIPLLMLLLPLMMLAVLPTSQLDLGSSLIPVTGMMLLLRTLIEGDHSTAMPFVGPVLIVTVFCCYLSVRWAVAQFNNENVLFRASDQVGVGRWVKQVLRERSLKPTIGHAVMCLVVVLIIKFFVSLAIKPPTSFGDFTKQVLIIQVATIAIPTILLAAILTRCPKTTLRLKGTRVGFMCAAVLIAILAHPMLTYLSKLVVYIYPYSPELMRFESAVGSIIDSAPGIFALLFVFALVPAICEEIAFRGFMLSGLESLKGKWAAVLLSSLFFGITHAVFQQSVMAFVTGCFLGFIALKTSSILPCILYHLTHNGLTVLMSQCENLAGPNSTFGWLFTEVVHEGTTSVEYNPVAAAAMGVLALILLYWLGKASRSYANSSQPDLKAQLKLTGNGQLSP